MEKLHKLLLVFFVGALSIACSSDDNADIGGNNDGPIIPQLGYFPQNVGNSWTYDIQSEDFSEQDHLYVSGETTQNGVTYKTFATDNTPTGFYTSLLTTGKLSSDNSKILYSGTINIGEILGGIEGLSFDLTNFVILDNNASLGNLLSSQSGEFYQDLGEYGLNVEYTLASTSSGDLETLTLENGTTHNDIKIVNLSFSLKIDAIFTFMGVQIPYTILSTQEVVSSTQYYAYNIGMIFAETQIQYQLEEIPNVGIEIPVPENYQYNLKEILTNFSLENS